MSGWRLTAATDMAAAVLLLLAPLSAALAPRTNPPPPPRFVPIQSDVRVIALHSGGPGRAAPDSASALTGDTTLISKTASAASVAGGNSLHYSITVTNATPTNQTFLLTDTLPASESYLNGTASGGFTYDPGSNSLTASLPLGAFHGDIITPSGAPPYTEISGSGQNICSLFATCDDRSVTLGGVAFRYLGVDYTSVTLDSNGFVIPGSVNPGAANQNQDLPDPAAPNNVIAPFWGDLHSGGWYYGVLHDNGANVNYLVVEWHNAQKKGDSGTSYSFQVWIQLGAEHITFAYAGLSGSTTPATIGFENSNGTLGHSYLYNGAGSVPGAGSQLQIVAAYTTALLGYDVQVQPGLRGCSQVSNTVSLSGSPSSVAATATASTALFGPCLFLPSVRR
jgi:uncharacterized repeat protein (TIGR01451 family)